MLGSLRFRLPALFLLGILLAGLVASLISIRFFQSYKRARAIDELRSESVGIVQLYATAGGPRDGAVASARAARSAATASSGCRRSPARRCSRRIPPLPRATVDMKQLRRTGTTDDDQPANGRHELPRGRAADSSSATTCSARSSSRSRRRSCAAARSRSSSGSASRSAAASSSRACSASISRGGSRSRCASSRSRPTRWRRASTASSCRARAGSDEISHLSRAVRRHGGEARRVGAAVAQLPDVGVARAADAADGDPRACVGAARRRDRRSVAAARRRSA